MADAPTLSPEPSRSVLALARTLVAAARPWEPGGRGDFTWGVVESVDPESAGINPLHYK
jgi:hypothetical protein